MKEIKAGEFRQIYIRMLQQEKFVESIIRVSEEEMLDLDLKNDLDENIGVLEQGDVDEITKNHFKDPKWLCDNVQIVERRFAYAVKKVIEKDESQMLNLETAIYELGQTWEPDYKDLPVRHTYNLIRNLLLDGVASEEINEIISENDDEIVWKRKRSTTQKYWTYLDIDFNKYFLPLRRAFIQGFIEKTDIEFKKLDDTVCVLSKRR
ncbi:hypothetical protein [Peptostreptococcus faecalis]|uniref:hypothetical protein n=1 Tax=Peptostreptococcus faecalis TaxID=2045015 RepID=UPI000C7CFE27|nr:hypothetical protein [Peptostreptococcus faecalis]